MTSTLSPADAVVTVPFIVKGQTLVGSEEAHTGATGAPWASASIDLDALVWSRQTPPPLFDVPSAEIIDLLVATGDLIREDAHGYMSDALAGLISVCGASAPLAERNYLDLWKSFEGGLLRFQLDQEVGGPQAVDTWQTIPLLDGTTANIRAFPARMIHILAGNAPGVASITVARAALAKGVCLLKMASNDLFTAPAILRYLVEAAPGHPLARSFSAVYWRGGDRAIESTLMRSQFFDKIVVWGGDSAVANAAHYAGPGLELISFDPKNSISFIGHEAFESDHALREAAEAAATDATLHNQDACSASRFQFVEGSIDEADQFCSILVGQLNVERTKAAAQSSPVPPDVREEIDALRSMEDYYRVWGRYDGTGMVVRTDEPVGFYPVGRVVNVIPVPSLGDAIKYVNAATQTVGIYPASRRPQYRDALCNAGVQHVTSLGSAGISRVGVPHDGFYPIARFLRWSRDDD